MGKSMSNEDSMQIIQEMIAVSKGNFQQNSFYFLLWGWVAIIAHSAHFVLMEFTAYAHPYVVWLISIPAWIVTFVYAMNQRKRATVITQFDKIISLLWILFGISILVVVAFGYKINFQITALVLLLSALPTIVTGKIIRFKPLIIGGISFTLFAIIAFLVPKFSYQFPVAVIAILSGFVIPGHLLRAEGK